MIEVKNITKNYGDTCAVNNVTLNIRNGEITGLLGPNGAGKTTTMRMITGYLEATSGEVFVGGIDIKQSPVEVKKMIGYLPESAPLYDDMLVYDYLEYVADIHNVKSEQRILDIANLCGLIEVMHKNINELSRGYKQRVGLAHAMIHDPEILILDEPTSGLDPNQIIEIRNLIKEIGKEKTVILSTHILSEVEATCDRVVIINQGSIVADNTTVELQSVQGKNSIIKVKVKGSSFNQLSELVKKLTGVKSFKEVKDHENLTAGEITVAGENDIRPELFKIVKDNNWILFEMIKQQHTLENVFRDLTLGGSDE